MGKFGGTPNIRITIIKDNRRAKSREGIPIILVYP